MHFIRSLFRLQTLNPHLKMDRCKIKTHRCKANTPLTGISPGFPLKLLFPMQLTVSSWDIAFLCLQEGTNQPPSPCNFEIKYRSYTENFAEFQDDQIFSQKSFHVKAFETSRWELYNISSQNNKVLNLSRYLWHRYIIENSSKPSIILLFPPSTLQYWQLTAVNYDICSFPTKPARSQRYPGLMKKHWHFSWQWCSLHHFFHRILAVFWLFFDHLKVMSELCFLPFIPFLLSEDHLSYSTVIKTKAYVERLVSISDVSINNVITLFGFINVVTQETFVKNFSRILNGNLTNSSGWRRFMADTFIVEPPKKEYSSTII